MGERFKWERNGDGFIAYPEGRDFRPYRSVLLSPFRKDGGNLTGMWTYSPSYDGRHTSGNAANRQAAADAADERWPRFIAELAEAARVAAAEQAYIDLAKQLNGPVRTFDELNLTTTAGPLLLRTMRELEAGPVRVAISAELFRRRTSGELPSS